MDKNKTPEPFHNRLLPRPNISLPSTGLSLSPPPKKHRLGWWIFGIILALVIAIALGLVGGYSWYVSALRPVSAEPRQVRITVEQGETTDQIADSLASVGAVRSALATQMYMRLNSTTVKSGHYVLQADQSTQEIVAWLASGRIDTFKATIIPGQTLIEIRAKLLEYGYSEADVQAALDKRYDHPLFDGLPEGSNLEGYIYPETYFVTSGSSAEDLLLRSFDEFESKLEANNLRERLQARGFSLHQGIILASVVGAEVPSYEDRRTVAQVFETRLERGMQLGADATFEYAAQLLGVKPSPSLDSLYNTRLYSGLPPGPISNMTVEPLLAVVDPTSTDYLYFVSGDDGTTHFSHTFEEHETNIQQYCRKLCGLE